MKDDTISRAAAIDAMMKLQAEDIEAYGASIPEGFDGDRAVAVLKALPSAQPDVPDTYVGDMISRQAAIDALYDWSEHSMTDAEAWHIKQVIGDIKSLPSAQPNLSEAYSKAVFTWLMDYQIRAAELKGRYTPYEVLSWVINDWRKEHEQFD